MPVVAASAPSAPSSGEGGHCTASVVVQRDDFDPDRTDETIGSDERP